jgi:hypothetical protein
MMSPLPEELWNQFRLLLRRWTFWYRVQRAIQGCLRGVLLGLAIALGFILVAIPSGLGARYGLGLTEFSLLVFLAVGSGIVGMGLVGFFWPVSPTKLTRYFDATFKLDERTSTAEEILRQNASTVGVPEDLIRRQIADAVSYGNGIRPEPRFFWAISQRQLLITASLALALTLVTIFGQPYFMEAAKRQTERQAISSEITKLEELQEIIANEPGLSPQDKAELQKQLEETVRQLQETDSGEPVSLEQAVAVLTEAEEEIRTLANPNIQEQAEGLRQLGNQITQSEAGNDSGNPLQDFGEALSQNNPLAAAQELHNLDIEAMTAEQRQALAEQLAAAAEAAGQNNPQLAQQLQQAADALQNGNLEDAQQALEQAAESLNQTGSDMAQANAVQQAATQASEGADRLIQAGRSAEQAQADGSSENSGQSQGQNGDQGSQPGDGNGQQGAGSQGDSGQSSGSGAGIGSGDQGDVTGSQAGSDPIDQGNSPSDGGERPFVPLTDPKQLGGSGSADVYLPQSGAEGEVTGQAGTSPGEPGSSSVPYTAIYPAYAESIRQAVESGTIPPALRSLVQKYFSNLEP